MQAVGVECWFQLDARSLSVEGTRANKNNIGIVLKAALTVFVNSLSLSLSIFFCLAYISSYYREQMRNEA
jgi:hypothetical protein